MAWKMTHEQTEVGFEVVKMEQAKKAGHVVTYVKYPTMDQLYTYVRKTSRKEDGNYETVVDGCGVRYNPITLEVVSVTRLYDTKGMKKKTNPGSSGVKVGDAVASIKAEMEDKEIEVTAPLKRSSMKRESYTTRNMKQSRCA